jgi:cardiolipin synthase
MGRYRGRDILRVPGLLSLSRVPLAVAFPFVVGRPWFSLGVLVAAGISDVLDGWYARRFGQVTATGSALDPITDKIFVITVAFTLVQQGALSVGSVALLSAREIGELPLVLWIALSRRARRGRVQDPTANVAGKAATALQFVSVTAALFHAAHMVWYARVTGVVGALAAISYWRRALRKY